MNSKKQLHLTTSRSTQNTNKIIQKFLTKRLDKRQNTKIISNVHKNILKLLFFFEILFPNFLFSLDYKNNYCKEVKKHSLLLENVKWIIPNFFNDEQNLILFANQQLNFLLEQIIKIQEKNLHMECVKVFFKIESKLLFSTHELYFEILTYELKEFLEKKDPYNKDKILSDFLQNQNHLKKSYQKRINSLIPLLEAFEKKEDYEKHIEILKNWNLTYYILLYELFLNLPEEFLKEWWKKF